MLFIVNTNKAVLKLLIYFTSHKRIAALIMTIIPVWFIIYIYTGPCCTQGCSFFTCSIYRSRCNQTVIKLEYVSKFITSGCICLNQNTQPTDIKSDEVENVICYMFLHSHIHSWRH